MSKGASRPGAGHLLRSHVKETESNSEHDPQAVVSALASTKAAAGMLQQKKQKQNNSGTYRKNLGMRTDTRICNSSTNLLQRNVLKCDLLPGSEPKSELALR